MRAAEEGESVRKPRTQKLECPPERAVQHVQNLMGLKEARALKIHKSAALVLIICCVRIQGLNHASSSSDTHTTQNIVFPAGSAESQSAHID